MAEYATFTKFPETPVPGAGVHEGPGGTVVANLNNTLQTVAMPAQMSLAEYYRKYYRPNTGSDPVAFMPYGATTMATPFTDAFLSSANVDTLRRMLTDKVAQISNLPGLSPLPMTDQFLNELMTTASVYRTAKYAPDNVMRVNGFFVEKYAGGHTWEVNYAENTNRWCSDGFPDPNNIPLPMVADREEREADPTSYLLSHPWGGLIPKY